jgi:hypothetical protein
MIRMLISHILLLCRTHVIIFRYFDKVSSNFTNPVELKALSLASKLPFVRIYDNEQMNLVTEGEAMLHCLSKAHLDLKAEWIVDFDIDEVFAFGDPITTQSCDHDMDYLRQGELSQFIAQVPRNVVGILLPRFEFGQNGVKIHPTNATQMEVYTRRSDRVSNGGKVMRRVVSDGSIEQRSKHDFLAKGRKNGIFPNGKPAFVSGDCTENNGMCLFTIAGSGAMIEDHVSYPRLHHYTSRSLEDCRRKITDSNATWRVPQRMFPWRLLNAGSICDESKDMDVDDYSVYCASKKVREDLSQLFPSFDNEPRVY